MGLKARGGSGVALVGEGEAKQQLEKDSEKQSVGKDNEERKLDLTHTATIEQTAQNVAK